MVKKAGRRAAATQVVHHGRNVVAGRYSRLGRPAGTGRRGRVGKRTGNNAHTWGKTSRPNRWAGLPLDARPTSAEHEAGRLLSACIRRGRREVHDRPNANDAQVLASRTSSHTVRTCAAWTLGAVICMTTSPATWASEAGTTFRSTTASTAARSRGSSLCRGPGWRNRRGTDQPALTPKELPSKTAAAGPD